MFHCCRIGILQRFIRENEPLDDWFIKAAKLILSMQILSLMSDSCSFNGLNEQNLKRETAVHSISTLFP